MTKFDALQQQVLALDPMCHARVLGAPGTGKTMLLVEAFARSTAMQGPGTNETLVLAPNRIVAAALRARIEQRVRQPLGGVFVRTASSLAFSILQRDAALRGVPAPRLLTGTAHDEAVAAVINEQLERQHTAGAAVVFAPEVLQSNSFRAELRELDRVLNDFSIQPTDLLGRLGAGSEDGSGFGVGSGTAAGAAFGGSVPSQLSHQWGMALRLLEGVRRRLSSTRTEEMSSSAMQHVACCVVGENSEITLPKLVLVDDAAELGEGALALLAALVARGTKVWVFGDPDIATGAFQGERTRVISGLAAELNRRLHKRTSEPTEQLVVLDTVYRHGGELRKIVAALTGRIGAAGAGQQRKAVASTEHTDRAESVEFAAVATAAEQLGVVAHRLRSAHLGVAGGEAKPWSNMAVICRSRSEVKRVSRQLAEHQVPSSVIAGGVVLREHQLVRELIRMLQHSLGHVTLSAVEVLELLGGAIGGLDPIALRRLRGALRLQEVRAAQAADRHPVTADALILEFFEQPGEQPVLDMQGARRLHRLGKLAAAAAAVRAAGGTAREVLWQIWSGSGLAEGLQQHALENRGVRSAEAHRALDAVLGLFFALQRHEEQDSEQPVEELLADLLLSTVATDSIAAGSERDVVTVTTAQGTIGREFDVVCVLGVQDGAWPNLRARGSLLGVTALERWLRGDEALMPTRRDTMHDELRLFAHTIARARDEVLVVSVSNEDQHPGVFFSLGEKYRVERALPSSRLTLRGVVAEMRRRLTQDLSDREALDSLVALAREGVQGAHPDEWYGVMPLSSHDPLVDIDNDVTATVPVSPSQMEKAETCPLDWIISRLGGGRSNYRANIGTLLHQAMESAAPGVTAEELLKEVKTSWGSLKFEAVWQEERALAETEFMVTALASYLAKFEYSNQQILANEASFALPVGFTTLRGSADRIEATPLAGGGFEVTVVDLKTGRRAPTSSELQQHAQLQAYQLGVLRGAFVDGQGTPIEAASVGGAKLLYVHPDAISKTRKNQGEKYTEVLQSELSEQQQQEFEHRVQSVGRIMAGREFTAELEHHCENQYSPSRACSLHVISAVSHS